MTKLAATILPAIALCVAAAAVGCGAKSKLRPPQAVRPAPIRDLRVTNVADGVEIAWSRPENYTGGKRMSNLAAYLILRGEGSADDFSELVRLAYTGRQKLRQPRRSLYIDADTRIGALYRYKIVSITTDNYRSAESNEAAIVRVAPLPQPNPENFVLTPGTPTSLPSPAP